MSLISPTNFRNPSVPNVGTPFFSTGSSADYVSFISVFQLSLNQSSPSNPEKEMKKALTSESFLIQETMMPDTKISLQEFKELVQPEFYKEQKGELKAAEISEAPIWEKMQTQLFRVEDRLIQFYAVHNRKITLLGGEFSCSLRTAVCDLDNDGKYECIYTYEYGSGVSVGVLGIYSPTEKMEIGKSCLIPPGNSMANFVFEKKSDRRVDVYVDAMNEKIMQGTLILKSSDGRKILEIGQDTL